MKLYHGSSVVVRKPLIARGRKTTDFGKGFYTTTDFEQAARWARIKRERLGHGKAVVSVYDFDERFLEADEFQVLRYQGATEKWLDLVVRNRKGVLEHHYDLVMGPVANDRLYATIIMYEKGDLSVEAAIVQLKTHVLFDQLSFHSREALKLSSVCFFGGSVRIVLKIIESILLKLTSLLSCYRKYSSFCLFNADKN